jgi:hypothetical protein
VDPHGESRYRVGSVPVQDSDLLWVLSRVHDLAAGQRRNDPHNTREKHHDPRDLPECDRTRVVQVCFFNCLLTGHQATGIHCRRPCALQNKKRMRPWPTSRSLPSGTRTTFLQPAFRPLNRLMTRTTNPTTRRMWISPPPICRLKPRSHKIRRTTRTVQSTFNLPNFAHTNLKVTSGRCHCP